MTTNLTGDRFLFIWTVGSSFWCLHGWCAVRLCLPFCSGFRLGVSELAEGRCNRMFQFSGRFFGVGERKGLFGEWSGPFCDALYKFSIVIDQARELHDLRVRFEDRPCRDFLDFEGIWGEPCPELCTMLPSQPPHNKTRAGRL